MSATLFFSYSHADEKMRDELEKHLSALKKQGLVATWHDRKILPGDEWDGKIDHNLMCADIILLLISQNFLASSYCYDVEVMRALERHEAGDARVIPIILRPVDWQGAPFGMLQALPKDAKPITTWRSRDTAFVNIAQEIRRVLMATDMARNKARSDEVDSIKLEFHDGISLNHPSDAAGGLATAKGNLDVELTIDADYDNYSEGDKQRLLRAVASLLEMKDSTVQIVRVKRGRVKVTLRMSPKQAEKLLWASKRGMLDQFAVVDAAVVDAAVVDAAVVDAAVVDTAVVDTAVVDTAVVDTAVVDTAVVAAALAAAVLAAAAVDESPRKITERLPGDSASPEVQIAALTARIILLTERLQRHPKEYTTRRGLLALVRRRRRLLDYLRLHAPDRYNDITQRLGIRK